MIVYRTKFFLTKFLEKNNKQFAFGMLQESVPRVCFVPHWIVQTYELNEDDVGEEIDCLFVEQREKNPMVVGIIIEGEDLCEAIPVGYFELEDKKLNRNLIRETLKDAMSEFWDDNHDHMTEEEFNDHWLIKDIEKAITEIDKPQ